ncbi:MAG TPA: galactitol-1-phosphate 5-dehydrogenase [Symbiobacteriaceae bacterium]
MKAVRLHSPGDLRVEDVPIPTPGPHDLLVQVGAAGVCGSDIPRAMVVGAHKMPITLGHEFSGTVVEVGKEVKGFVPGDRVTVAPLIPCNTCRWCRSGNYSLCERYDYFGSRRDGAFAEFVTVPEGNAVKLPENIPLETAALCDPASIAVHAFKKAGTSLDGKTVAIFGAGPIGLLAVQIAKLLGAARVVAVDVEDPKIQQALDVGADAAVNSRRQDPVAFIQEFTQGELAQVVLDTAGTPQTQEQSILATGRLGVAVWVGISHRDLTLSEKAVDMILRRELQVVGSWNSFSAPFPGDEWTRVVEWMRQGKIRTEPIITHRLPLDQAPEIFKHLYARDIFFGKVLFLPRG